MNSYNFTNTSDGVMTFDVVFQKIQSFILQDPTACYVLSIGSDSQTYQKETRFITAIHLHRKGKGAWGCIRKLIIPRPIDSIREKISLETSLSQEIAYLFTDDHLLSLSELIVPYEKKGASLTIEIHLDIGRKGLTKELIQDMVGRITAMGMDARIKPESYTAFSYANRYTR
ncbi:ribonuclease H-like YkuK family protein [Aeribacillus pallidus]|jgi:uncharacterized protein|uniref:ribonuclease H-like YkuK family protein n=1 Tax=Aeribacillus pallidus TaxID=33936 RepID=UPI001D81598E|nr:ribonuclease H-like YkuK family protein [Bacillus sp. (in: firmicutes)]